MSKTKKPRDYDVGYAKPPQSTRFKLGQSGNPQGRPKGQRNLATDIEQELSETILVNEGGRQTVITKQRAMIKALLAKALKGDTRASAVLIQLAQGVEQAQASRHQIVSLDREDRAILESYLRRGTSADSEDA